MRKMILTFTAALLVAFLTDGGCEAKSARKMPIASSQCPKFPSGMMTLCYIGPNWCADNSHCPAGMICCPWGCGGECMAPVRNDSEEEPPVKDDRCGPPSPISPLIYCTKIINECESHDDCEQGICCPFAGCGNRCQPEDDGEV